MEVIGQIEALLFVSGDEGVSVEELAVLLQIPTSKIFEEIDKLRNYYEVNNQSALHVLEVGNRFVLTTKKLYAETVKEFAQSPLSNTLSQAVLETLAIVTYKQPITRSEIDVIRGVQSAGAIQKLVARQLIVEKGRVDGPGRPILYGTSDYFMNYFGLESLEELPSIREMEEEMTEEELPSDLFFANFQEGLDGANLKQSDNQQELIIDEEIEENEENV
ncbi:SMC-Scp complex subunit ScpB [Vagococcus intermedius]|uniref:Segregation and condensation protein B n=1 Tax=Vagococcus intermedius TaxID=2991418 RepID=A0AAF0CWP0_9ENTE|nr:SMC-Scp complex subunit ScpB [Vagococcus intermedius]WEG74258.1 SMC-Scp complex subunit ScpB [Vagococcus intermedius]WEG76340.1 SMC-Scp complex subunit ScpB [Vagococcus intermedius]